MCLRFVFLLITRLTAWFRLARREEAWKIAEILLLRHQLAVLQRQQPRRPKLNCADRALLATLLSVIPEARRPGLRLLVTPDTILRWHRDLDLSRDKICPAGQEVMLDPVLIYRSAPEAGPDGPGDPAVGPGQPQGVFLGGNLCLERDMIFNHLTFVERLPEPGDIVAFVNTAAYQMDLSASEALMQRRAAKVAVESSDRGFVAHADRGDGPEEEPGALRRHHRADREHPAAPARSAQARHRGCRAVRQAGVLQPFRLGEGQDRLGHDPGRPARHHQPRPDADRGLQREHREGPAGPGGHARNPAPGAHQPDEGPRGAGRPGAAGRRARGAAGPVGVSGSHRAERRVQRDREADGGKPRRLLPHLAVHQPAQPRHPPRHHRERDLRRRRPGRLPLRRPGHHRVHPGRGDVPAGRQPAAADHRHRLHPG